MASHWKSTRSYWCKFCASYVRDSAIERKSHETSIKHQNNIQRSLRELHKSKEREGRDQQRAKDEVARLNGLVSGDRTTSNGAGSASTPAVRTTAPPRLDAAAQRKAHAEQLAALGVKLPGELQKEVTGVGEWQTVSTRVIADESTTGLSMAEILKLEQMKAEDSKDGIVKGVHKRRADEDEDAGEEERSKRRGAWGSRLKTYPGKGVEGDQEGDLDALLNGVTAKKQSPTKEDEAAESQSSDALKGEDAVAEQDLAASSEIKQEYEDSKGTGLGAPLVPVFKKRKGKK